MQSEIESHSAYIRAKLSHPVIDTDGHWADPVPILLDYVKKIGGTSVAETYRRARMEGGNAWYALDGPGRLACRKTRYLWWGLPGNTLDRATTMLPRLMYERLDDFGLDFAVVISTGVHVDGFADANLRKCVARASNIMKAEMFGDLSDRMTPAALIPMVTPDEAIEEAEFVVKELGLKTAVISGGVRRPVPAYAKAGKHPPEVPYYIDTLALDSPYDYDPFWAKLQELRLSPMTHTAALDWVDRSSPSNFVANHLGHFAQAAHAFARSLYLGGVPTRFPDLRFAFLECGVAWARILCSDLVSHWEKRNVHALRAHLNPGNLDVRALRTLIDSYGGPWAAGRADEMLASIDVLQPGVDAKELGRREEPADDFARVNVHSKEEVARIFARSFFFGCESDDPLVGQAFDETLGPRLQALFSSDISHFDVTDMTEVLEEGFELVESGRLDEGQFRDYTFSNAVAFHAGMNPDFFRGTVVEQQASVELARWRNRHEPEPS